MFQEAERTSEIKLSAMALTVARPCASVVALARVHHSRVRRSSSAFAFGLGVQSLRQKAPRGSQWSPSQKPHIVKAAMRGWAKHAVRKSRV
jgi:hypothetical protein